MAQKVLKERDAMVCRSCSKEERASEGYPCVDCGTFVCLPCTMRGVVRCERCAEIAARKAETVTPSQRLAWPEH